jgi:hypothetical protein
MKPITKWDVTRFLAMCAVPGLILAVAQAFGLPIAAFLQ